MGYLWHTTYKENPCKPDCPNRNETCHFLGNCEAYTIFFNNKEENRKPPMSKIDDDIFYAYKKERVPNYKKRKRSLIK